MCSSPLSLLFLRQSRQVAMDVNTEPSQNEQIIWDDPTAREERARLASNLQWPSSPSQYSEQTGRPSLGKSLTDTEIAEMGTNRVQEWMDVTVVFESWLSP